ncbi:hypothetical protein [Aminipila luticellarii]|uniref:AAA domain-containing protein n=1 Tax=Aminipila luticellarii TaxID=2507160 RepID=A0A410PW63_9FIRM|nr:hypothetical protein [Aminipila luticellarii]QAT43183.1 hypothetical protein EQM06_07975 [Aminipila luticellarii]
MKNLFVFHGADHKSGVTMIAQSTAQLIASQNRDINVLFIALNGRKSSEFIKGEVKTIDEFKLQLDSKLLMSRDFVRDCKHERNLHILAGPVHEQEERYYFPDSATYLLESVADSFEIIIADTGNELDNGLALGGMSAAAKRYLILDQLESNLSRYEKMSPLFEKAGIRFDGFIINKFYADDPYTLPYILERLRLQREKAYTVQAASSERQAEREHKTLMECKTPCYQADISAVANDISEAVGLPSIKIQRKHKRWKNFI